MTNYMTGCIVSRYGTYWEGTIKFPCRNNILIGANLTIAWVFVTMVANARTKGTIKDYENNSC